MSAVGRWLSIIGIGEDGLEGLSPAARMLVAQASLVVGGVRHLALAADAVRCERLAWPSPPQAAFPAILARRGSPVCVLASGDPFFHGIGSLLTKAIPPEETICLPAASSFSLAASRLGWAVQDCALVSLHGRPLERIVPHLQPHARILALSWDQGTPGAVSRLLVRHGFADAAITVCEALGGPRERLRRASAADFGLDDIDPLNVTAVELSSGAGACVLPLAAGLPDAWFEHDGQLTKQDIRALTLAALAPRRGELLWDIGAGSGSVGIEWMLASSANRAVAIERDPVRAGRIARNAAALGVPDLRVLGRAAPEALHGLPVPDAVFIGGGATAGCVTEARATRDGVLGDGVIETAWAALRGGGRLVANGVTLETQAMLFRWFQRVGGALKTIQIARVDGIGGFHAMRPAMAVTQWSVTKP